MSGSQSSTISTHIAGCDFCADKLRQTTKYISRLAELSRVQAGATEKRREPRIPVADSASMRMIYPSQADRVPIKVVNASGGGLKLSVPEFVAPGAVFQILLEGLMITAEVRYCLHVGNEFHAGVAIQDIFSSGTY